MKIAMLSRWHVHARGYANQVRENGHEVAVIWDDNVERGQGWARELGVPYESDLGKVLAMTDVDGVIVNTETSKHKDVIIASAKAKKHVFTEKTLAATVAECIDIEKAIEENGVIFTIGYSQRSKPVVLYAKSLIEAGALGRITSARLRNAHGGSSDNWLPQHWYVKADAQGGAMIDMGCHPLYIISYLLGEPARVASVFNEITGRGVDDNAVSVIEFKNQAIAVIETALVSPVSPWALELYGTEGTLIALNNSTRISTKQTQKMTDGFIDVTKLPNALPTPLQTWFNAIEKGAPVVYGMKDAIALAELIELAYISHEKGIVAKA